MNPFLVGVFDTPGNARKTKLVENLAFVADGTWESGLQIVDIGDPSHPVGLGVYDSTSAVFDVTENGNYAYLADYASGLRVIDISDITNPSYAGSLRTASSPLQLATQGSTAYVSTWAGLQIIDMSEPTQPVLKAAQYTPGQPGNISIKGDYLYVEERIFDVDAPSYPLNILRIIDFSNLVSIDDFSSTLADSILTYTVTWSNSSAGGDHVKCIVSGGGCEVVSVDTDKKTAVVEWNVPDRKGDYEIRIAVGNNIYFNSSADQIIVN